MIVIQPIKRFGSSQTVYQVTDLDNRSAKYCRECPKLWDAVVLLPRTVTATQYHNIELCQIIK